MDSGRMSQLDPLQRCVRWHHTLHFKELVCASEGKAFSLASSAALVITQHLQDFEAMNSLTVPFPAEGLCNPDHEVQPRVLHTFNCYGLQEIQL